MYFLVVFLNGQDLKFLIFVVKFVQGIKSPQYQKLREHTKAKSAFLSKAPYLGWNDRFRVDTILRLLYCWGLGNQIRRFWSLLVIHPIGGEWIQEGVNFLFLGRSGGQERIGRV
jgi:hypothetical protein